MSFGALILGKLGYPEQALKKSGEALALAHALSHPHSIVFAQGYAAALHHIRRDLSATQEAAEKVIALSDEYGFTDFLASAACSRGWALAQQGKMDEGISLIHKCLAAARATGMELDRTGFLCSRGLD